MIWSLLLHTLKPPLRAFFLPQFCFLLFLMGKKVFFLTRLRFERAVIFVFSAKVKFWGTDRSILANRSVRWPVTLIFFLISSLDFAAAEGRMDEGCYDEYKHRVWAVAVIYVVIAVSHSHQLNDFSFHWAPNPFPLLHPSALLQKLFFFCSERCPISYCVLSIEDALCIEYFISD